MNETKFHEIMSEINADSNIKYEMAEIFRRQLPIFADDIADMPGPEIILSSERKEHLLYYKLIDDNSEKIIANAKSAINEMNKNDSPLDQKLLKKIEKLIKKILSPEEYNRLVKLIYELIDQLEYLRDSKDIKRFSDKSAWSINDLIGYFRRFPENYKEKTWTILGEFIAGRNRKKDTIVLYYSTIWKTYTEKKGRLSSDFTYYSYIREVLSHELFHYYNYHLVLQKGSERQWNRSNEKTRAVKEGLATIFEFIWLWEWLWENHNVSKDMLNTIVLDKVCDEPFPENPYTAVKAFLPTINDNSFMLQVFKESLTDWNKAFSLIYNNMPE